MSEPKDDDNNKDSGSKSGTYDEVGGFHPSDEPGSADSKEYDKDFDEKP